MNPTSLRTALVLATSLRTARVLAASLTVIASLATSCANDDNLTPPFAAASTTILLDHERDLLHLTSPDEARVVSIDARTLAVVASIDTPSAPAHLLAHGRTLLVTLDDAPDLLVIDPHRETITGSLPLPCGRSEGIVPLGPSPADPIAVTCPDDRLLLVIDPATPALLARIPIDGRPGLPAVLDHTLALPLSADGALLRFPIPDLTAARGLTPLTPTRDPLAAPPDRTAANAFIALPDPHRATFHVLFDAVDNDGDRSRPPEQGTYGSVVDGEPRIEPRVHGTCLQAYARFDGGPRVFSGAGTAALSPDGRHLLIAHRGTRNLAILPCATSPADPPPPTVPIGAGVRGIALSPDGSTAWLDLGFDLAVARIEPLHNPAITTLRRTPTQHRLSPRAQLGRSLFHDATNTHLTPSGIVACATCHPSGTDDGLSWFLHTPGVSPRFVRTPPAWALRPELLPAHRNGEFSDGATLTRHTIRELMGGDALVINADAIVQWMNELHPPNPLPTPPDEAPSVTRGEALFHDAGCATCHSGPWLTDNLPHHVVPPSTDPLAHIPDGVITPTLRGVRARPPYLHDGRAPTLRALLTDHNPDDTHGLTSPLSPSDLDDLVRYLHSL